MYYYNALLGGLIANASNKCDMLLRFYRTADGVVVLWVYAVMLIVHAVFATPTLGNVLMGFTATFLNPKTMSYEIDSRSL